MLQRRRYLTIILNELDGYFTNNGLRWERFLPHGGATDIEVIQHLASKMNVELRIDELELLRQYMNTAAISTSTIESRPYAWDASDPALVRNKIPGLIELLFSHISYQTK